MKAISTILLLVALLSIIIESPKSETTIQWWQFATDPAVRPTIQKMVENFEKENPELKVNITDLTWANGHEKIVMAFASGSGPDIVELGSDWIAQFAENNHLVNLTAEAIKDSSQSEGWGMATYQDSIYAIPWILGTRVIFYNRSLISKAGYKKNFTPITWGTLKQAISDIHNLGRNTYGWGSNTAEKHRLYKKFLPFFWSTGARVFSGKGGFCIISSVNGIEALKFYKELHDNYGYVANQRGIEDAFLDGKIGFIFSGEWLLKRIEREKRKIDLGSMIIPGPTQRNSYPYPGKSFMGGEFLAVNAASKYQPEALKFIKYITSPENQVKFCKANRSANPSSIKAQKDDYFQSNRHLKTFIRQLKQSMHPPVDPDWVYIENEIERAVERVLFESVAPADALHDARNKISKIKNQ